MCDSFENAAWLDSTVVQWFRKQTAMQVLQPGESRAFEGEWIRANFIRFCVSCMDESMKTPFPDVREVFHDKVMETFTEEEIDEALFWTRRVLRDIDAVQKVDREFKRRGFLRAMNDRERLAGLVCKSMHVQLIWETMDDETLIWILNRIETTPAQRESILSKGYTTDITVLNQKP